MATDGIVGAVLVGGESRRMGNDKALARIGPSTLRDRALAIMDSVFDEVLLSAAHPGARVAGRRLVEDRRRGLGPLAALEAVLVAASGRDVFVLACDLPLIGRAAISRVLSSAEAGRGGSDAKAWVASCGGRLQPLCGLYAADCLGVVGERLDNGQLSMHRFLTAVDRLVVELDDLGEETLLNVNHPADLERARSLVDGR